MTCQAETAFWSTLADYYVQPPAGTFLTKNKIAIEAIDRVNACFYGKCLIARRSGPFWGDVRCDCQVLDNFVLFLLFFNFSFEAN